MSVHRVLTWLCERPQGDFTLAWLLRRGWPGFANFVLLPKHSLEAVVWQYASRETVAEDSVQRIDPRGRARHTYAPALRVFRTAPPGRAQQARRPDPPQGERHSEDLRAPRKKRQIEPGEVIVFDDIRIFGCYF